MRCSTLALALPFALIALYHNSKYAMLSSSSQPVALRRGQRAVSSPVSVSRLQRRRVGEPLPPQPELQPQWPATATTPNEPTEPGPPPFSTTSTCCPDVGAGSSALQRSALSSKEAMEVALGGGIAPEPGSGLGAVTTPEAFHTTLPRGEIVWLTFSNHAYLHFAQNWYAQVRWVGRHKHVIVAALDPPTLQAWRELRVPVLDHSNFGDTSDFRGIGADQARFRRMGAMKVAAFLSLLELGRAVLVSDVDSVWLADPTPFLESLHGVDLGVTSDCLSRAADADKAGNDPRFNRDGTWFCKPRHNPARHKFGATFNTGVVYLSPTKGAIAFTRAWRDMLLAPTEDWHMEDQRAFNQMVMTEFYPTVAAPEHARDGAVVLAANRTLRLMPLPAAKFCGGHTFFVQQSMEPQECFNVHVTFTEGGVHGKLWRLREAALWNLEPSGHFAGGRYLVHAAGDPDAVPAGARRAARRLPPPNRARRAAAEPVRRLVECRPAGGRRGGGRRQLRLRGAPVQGQERRRRHPHRRSAAHLAAPAGPHEDGGALPARAP